MAPLSGFKYRDVVRKLRKLGFAFDRQARGSHEIWLHGESGRRTTIPHHRRELREGTVRAILREAEIEVDDFLNA
jgi:predicted RNA binding protein YcfA (HicA-like mRNA interferase family)